MIYSRLCKISQRLLWVAIKLKYENDTVMNSRFLVLSYTFGYPHQVPDLLLPQPHVGEKYPVMELQVGR